MSGVSMKRKQKRQILSCAWPIRQIGDRFEINNDDGEIYKY